MKNPTMKMLMLTILLLVFSTVAIACESCVFIVYYLPLEADFYIPPTRDYIIKYGDKIELKSQSISDLFKAVSAGNGIELKAEECKDWRILITKKGSTEEIIITSDKQVVSSNKKYSIEKKIVENILNEIIAHKNKNQGHRACLKTTAISNLQI